MNVALTFLPLPPMANVIAGSKVKSVIHGGWHVYAGTIGALYAEAGITAADDGYESEVGVTFEQSPPTGTSAF